MKARAALGLLGLLGSILPAVAQAGEAFEATIFGVPAAQRWTIPETIPYDTRRLVRFPERAVPPIFWHGNELEWGFAAQEGAAPLVFVIAGTGGQHDERVAGQLHRILHAAGFHVAAMSSPTHPSFVAAGSASGVPGFAPADAEDLAAAMLEAREALLADEIEITTTSLVGYSLGGTEAAFVADLDARSGVLGLHRCFLLNPAVGTASSARALDRLYDTTLPGGTSDVLLMIDKTMNFVLESAARTPTHQGALGADFLMRTAAAAPAGVFRPKALVAAAFRLSAANLAFSADVIGGGASIVSPETDFGVASPLTEWFATSLEWSFGRYVDELLLEHWQKARPDLTLRRLEYLSSLASIDEFLRTSSTIAVSTNADDFILDAREVEFLRRTFGERARIHERGGHLGNVMAKKVVRPMLEFLEAPRLQEPLP